MSLPHKIEWWLLHDSKTVAAEVSACQPSRRAWLKVGVARNNPRNPNQHLSENVQFGVRYFEVEKSVLDDAKYNDRYIENEEVLNQEIVLAKNEEELERILARWLSDLDKLVLPYFCDCPI